MEYLGIILAIILVIVIYLVSIYNQFIRVDNKVQEALSGIDVALARRYSTLTNVVEVVKGYAKHEEGVFEKVTQLRAGFVNASTPSEKIDMDNQLTGTLKTLSSFK